MKNFIKQKPIKSSALTIVLIFIIGMLTNCSSSRNTSNNPSEPPSNAKQNQNLATEKNQSNVSEMPKSSPAKTENKTEKSPETNKVTEISGKYAYRYTEDYGGEISFVFKDKNKLDYEWMQEDVTWKGDGNWVWDEAKQTLTATVFTEPDVETAAESANTPPRKEIFVFQKAGNDFKLSDPPSGMTSYKGKVFQKK